MFLNFLFVIMIILNIQANSETLKVEKAKKEGYIKRFESFLSNHSPLPKMKKKVRFKLPEDENKYYKIRREASFSALYEIIEREDRLLQAENAKKEEIRQAQILNSKENDVVKEESGIKDDRILEQSPVTEEKRDYLIQKNGSIKVPQPPKNKKYGTLDRIFFREKKNPSLKRNNSLLETVNNYKLDEIKEENTSKTPTKQYQTQKIPNTSKKNKGFFDTLKRKNKKIIKDDESFENFRKKFDGDYHNFETEIFEWMDKSDDINIYSGLNVETE